MIEVRQQTISMAIVVSSTQVHFLSSRCCDVSEGLSTKKKIILLNQINKKLPTQKSLFFLMFFK